MPHIWVEYSEELEPESHSVMRAVYQQLLDSGMFTPSAIKARKSAYAGKDAILPEGMRFFIHITVRILNGRSGEQRAALSQSIFDAVNALPVTLDSLSVDIHEMEKETYRK